MAGRYLNATRKGLIQNLLILYSTIVVCADLTEVKTIASDHREDGARLTSQFPKIFEKGSFRNAF